MSLRAAQRLSAANADGSITVIEPPRGRVGVDWAELWRYRELFGYMVWRDLKVRYKQTLLGVSWAVIVPFVQMVVFTMLFGRVANLSSDGLPHAIYYMMNLTLWRLFQQGVTQCSGSLVNHANLLTKVYFPRLIIPAAVMLRAMVDFAIAFVMLMIVMAANTSGGVWAPVWPAATAPLAIVPLLLTLATALGIGLFFAALNVRYRDITELAPFLLQIWMYASVIIPFSALPERWGAWRYWYALNPVGGALEAFRWCLAGPRLATGGASPWVLAALGTPVALGLLAFGVYYFRRLERRFADII